ncbi:MAG: SEL1-like repeat protein [Thiolinea sp.]
MMKTINPNRPNHLLRVLCCGWLAAVPVGITQAADIASWYQERHQNSAGPSAQTLQALQSRAANDANAQYQLGLLYQSGRGVEKNLKKAYELFDQAARAGDAYGQYALALMLREAGDNQSLQQSMHWQLQAAQGGLPDAQYGLGLLYANGQYVERDLHKARHWLQQAAARDHEMARLALGELGARGASGTPTVAAPAVPRVAAAAPATVSSRSALQAQPATQVAMRTVEEDPIVRPASKAVAAPQNTAVQHNESRVDLAGMSPGDVRRAAEQGDMYAQLMLGALYEDGSAGVTQDYAQALAWYLKAARQGYPKAQHNLALLYEDGRGTQQNYQQAAHWYEKAAEAGFSEAQNNLAVLYILGNGVEADRNHAEQLLREAVAQGNENAKRNLQMLLNGAG